jgi:uncharacterized membrane protein YvlD (DUF360 family)
MLSLSVAEHVIGSLFFGGDYTKTFLLVSLALALLYFFLRPVLSLVGLPSHGIGFLFVSFVMSAIVLYVATLFIPSFYIRPTTLSDLRIFGFVLPSKSLTAMWAGVFSALVLSLTFSFLDWLCAGKRK